MLPDRRILRTLLAVVFALAASVPACQCPSSPPSDSKGEEATSNTPLWESIPLKRELFPFKWENVRHFEILRRDPGTPGESWALSLEKDMSSPDPKWKIASLEQDGRPDPADRLADTAFVNHLVDTLSTLRAEAPVTDMDEAMTGLLDPEWELRWMTESGDAFELRLGLPVLDGTTYAQVANPRDASQRSKIFTLRGAALEMLSRVTSLDVLRLRVLTPFDSDEVDALEVGGSGVRAFFAQRQGASWADRKNRELKNEEQIHAFLEQLVHLRTKAFEERPEHAAAIAAAVAKRPRYSVKFTDRQGTVTRLLIARHGDSLWSTVDGREGVAFELHPETEKIFESSPGRR